MSRAFCASPAEATEPVKMIEFATVRTWMSLSGMAALEQLRQFADVSTDRYFDRPLSCDRCRRARRSSSARWRRVEITIAARSGRSRSRPSARRHKSRRRPPADRRSPTCRRRAEVFDAAPHRSERRQCFGRRGTAERAARPATFHAASAEDEPTPRQPCGQFVCIESRCTKRRSSIACCGAPKRMIVKPPPFPR